MSMDTQLAPRARQSLAIPDDPVWRLSVSQYHHMIAAGILTDDDPVELLEGWLITRMPKNPSHRLVTQLTRETLAQLLPAGWYVDAQEPITMEDSEPEPDLVIVRGERRRYTDRHPGAADVAVVVEVSDTTLQRDRTLKQRLYARGSIPIYWIINLVERKIEVYTQPSGPAEAPAYQHRQDYDMTDTLPLVVDEQTVGRLAVRDLLS